MAKEVISLRLERTLPEKAKLALGAKSNTRAIEMALETVIEMDSHRRLIRRFSAKGTPDDFVHS
jgi:hypothetical protein